MPRSGFADFVINFIAGVLAFALLVAIAYFAWGSGVLDPLAGIMR